MIIRAVNKILQKFHNILRSLLTVLQYFPTKLPVSMIASFVDNCPCSKYCQNFREILLTPLPSTIIYRLHTHREIERVPCASHSAATGLIERRAVKG